LNGFKITGVKGVGFYPLPSPFSEALATLAVTYATYVVVAATRK